MLGVLCNVVIVLFSVVDVLFELVCIIQNLFDIGCIIVKVRCGVVCVLVVFSMFCMVVDEVVGVFRLMMMLFRLCVVDMEVGGWVLVEVGFMVGGLFGLMVGMDLYVVSRYRLRVMVSVGLVVDSRD